MGKREQNRAQRRARALSAARGLVTAGGLDALSMRKLSAASGMAVNTLYGLFGSRQQVVEAMIEEHLERRFDDVLGQSGSDSLDSARALVEASVRQAVEDAAYSRPMYRIIGQIRSLRRVGSRRAQRVLSELLSQAVLDGALRADTDVALVAEHMIDAFLDAAQRWAEGEIPGAELEASSLHTLYLCLAAVAAPQALDELQGRLSHAAQALREARAQVPPADPDPAARLLG